MGYHSGGISPISALGRNSIGSPVPVDLPESDGLPLIEELEAFLLERPNIPWND